MNSLLIQNAFKTLDEIESNEKAKRNLLESRKKKPKLKKGEHLNTCAGDPDINTAAFNHATNIGASSPSTGLGAGDGASGGVAGGLGEALDDDELWNKYVDKECVIKPTSAKYPNQVGKITDLISSGNSFEDCSWEVTLSQGIKIKIKGKDLKLGLEEELPKKDLKNEKLNDAIKESMAFNLRDSKDVEEAKKFKNKKNKEKDILVAVDPTAETKEEIHKPHVGDALLQCKDCKTIITIPSEDLVKDENEEDTYNVDTQCPHCGAKDGYDYIAQLATPTSEEAQKLEVKDDTKDKKDPSLEPQSDEIDNIDALDDLDNVNEVVEESFDSLVNKYTNRIFENLKGYKTKSFTQNHKGTYIVEGTLTFTNGKTANTKFLLEALNCKNGSVVFKGSNEALTPSTNAFRFKANLKEGKLNFNKLRYNYTEKIGNQNYLVEGLEVEDNKTEDNDTSKLKLKDFKNFLYSLS